MDDVQGSESSAVADQERDVLVDVQGLEKWFPVQQGFIANPAYSPEEASQTAAPQRIAMRTAMWRSPTPSSV